MHGSDPFELLATPAPNGTVWIATGTQDGVATITASAPGIAPVSLTVTHYHTLLFGCDFRYTPAFSFDHGAPIGDLYDTVPSAQGPLSPCQAAPYVAGATEQWHMPYGGTFAGTATPLASVQASQWKNDGTVFTPQPGVWLFKTSAGRIVKARLPTGPYEVSTTSGAFPF